MIKKKSVLQNSENIGQNTFEKGQKGRKWDYLKVRISFHGDMNQKYSAQKMKQLLSVPYISSDGTKISFRRLFCPILQLLYNSVARNTGRQYPFLSKIIRNCSSKYLRVRKALEGTLKETVNERLFR